MKAANRCVRSSRERRWRRTSHTICRSSVRPRHPFAGEGEYNVAVLEFRRHCDQRRISHPNECRPKDPEGKQTNNEGKTRFEYEDLVTIREIFYPILINHTLAGQLSVVDKRLSFVRIRDSLRRGGHGGRIVKKLFEVLRKAEPLVFLEDEQSRCQELATKQDSIWNKAFLNCRSLSRRIYLQRCVLL